MRIVVDLDSLPILKADLRTALPRTPATHRLEALARGLGFNTYAALRAALHVAPRLVGANDDAFLTYLSDKNFAANDRALRRTLARLAIRRIMDTDTELTAAGYGIAWSHYPTVAEQREAFSKQRAELLDDWSADQFELALKYLARLDRRKSSNRDYTTYNLKHQAERLSRDRGLFTHLGNYVSNGVFIVAALAAGFQVRRIAWDSLSGYVNATTRSIKATRTGQLVNRRSMALLYGILSIEAAA